MGDSGATSYTLIVLYVIIGAGCSVLLGYAVSTRFLVPAAPPPHDSDGQAAYMREVRMRNYAMLRAEARPRDRGPAMPRAMYV